MINTTTNTGAIHREGEASTYLFDDWFDPIEARPLNRAGELHGGANRLVAHEGPRGGAVAENGGDRETAL